MFKITTEVTYITERDLFLQTRYKLSSNEIDINDVDIYDVYDHELVKESNLLILKIKGKYSIIKSRY